MFGGVVLVGGVADVVVAVIPLRFSAFFRDARATSA